MLYLTKQKRCVAVVDAYSKKTGKTSYTMTEVSQWAIDNYLWPIPKRGDSEETCAAWELQLLKAASEVQHG